MFEGLEIGIKLKIVRGCLYFSPFQYDVYNFGSYQGTAELFLKERMANGENPPVLSLA